MPDNGLVARRITFRTAAAAGVAGPAVFTGAWVVSSLRQAGHGATDVQISGLAVDPDGTHRIWLDYELG